ncbi:hypothetical protein GO013_03720 [Pseudodesulfovibrio sp. JC047]|uniref:hypothetical protein n=1 Tax=Pseudodesulfovibrio sp. JC047 TaxID=2683199 RepID=UPI0013D3369E|nr:hypothetical protein [Pseudodesulfovibrio sp. JC047]NDV18526.1 hypothetical protein [Pseudodesulfovibrio sp. JC047]
MNNPIQTHHTDAAMNKLLPITLATLVFLFGCGGGSRPHLTHPPTQFYSTKTPQESGNPEHMGPQELQAAVMAYADTTNTLMGEASEIINRIGTPQARITAARMMVFNMSSNVEIAAGPYPGVALLDMTVVATLRRMVWEDFWIPKIFGDAGLPALAIIREAEQDIWDVAARIMTPQQIDELKRVISAWRTKYPNKISVNYVRFEDFGELGLKPSMRKLIVPGGLFASVQEATLVARDMKFAVDRAFYLVSRMQLLVNFQIKLAYLEMIFQPETNGLITTTEDIVSLSDQYLHLAEDFPEDMGKEISKLIDKLFLNLAKQRDETLNKALAGMSDWQKETIEDIVTSVSVEREAAINQTMAALVQQQNILFDRVDEVVNQSEREIESILNHAFMLGLLLIVIFFVLLTLYRIFVFGPTKKK